MKHTRILILALLFVSVSTLPAFSQAVSPEEFQKGLSQQGVQLLDVRTTKEYKNGHIKNSLLADWNKQDRFKESIQYLNKSKPVYVYCAGGVRSNAAAKWMKENGFENVKELQGGINSWNAEHKPTEGQPDEPQLTPDSYAALFEKSETVLVDFGGSWCPPCVQMNVVIESLQKNLKKKFQLVKLDPTVQVAIAGHLNIQGLPTFLVYKNGKEIYRKQGITSYEELKTQLLK